MGILRIDAGGEIMRTNRQIVFAILLSLLCMSRIGEAATRRDQVSSPGSGPVVIQVFPESTSLDLNSVDGAASLRQTSTQVSIAVTGVTAGSSHSIEVYACVDTDQALRLSGKRSAFTAANLRIRNDQGEWAELEELPNLEGRRGVRIGVLKGASTSISLEVQLQVPAGQAPGRYQGVLTIQALER